MRRLLMVTPVILSLRVAFVVALVVSTSLFVKPQMVLGQGGVPDPSMVISRQVDKIAALRKELEAAHVRILSSPSWPKTGQMAIRAVDGTLSSLTLMESQLLALKDMFMLHRLITDEGLLIRGTIILDQYRESLKSLTESCTDSIEGVLSLAEDQETFRLLLKAHGTSRSLSEVLGGIDYPKRR